MRIFIVQTLIKRTAGVGRGFRWDRSGLVLAELLIAVVIISLLVAMTQVNVLNLFGKSDFKGEVHDFVTTMEMAISAASESDKRYEVIIDVIEQRYMLREITSRDLLADVLEEEIIVEREFSSKCQVVYILFDDGVDSSEGAMFRAGRAGWQAGGKIVFLDADDQAHSVVVDRLSGIVRLEAGDAELLVPVDESELGF